MFSSVARPQPGSIEDEQQYLYLGDRARLESPLWSQAACQDARAEAFFPISVRDVSSRNEALAFCARCAIQSDCLATALMDPTLVGIWGGTDELERARMR